MRLNENPFYILGVLPEDTLDKIDEIVEEKSFMDFENESKYENARSVIINPSKRLEAEVGYLYKNKITLDIVTKLLNDGEAALPIRVDSNVPIEKVFISIEKIYSGKVTDISELLTQLDDSFSKALGNDEIDELINRINKARERAGITLCNDRSSVKLIIYNTMDEIGKSIGKILSVLSDSEVISLGHRFAEEKISSDLDDVVKLFLNQYENRTRDLVDSKLEKIKDLLSSPKIKNARVPSELNEVIEETESFFYAYKIIHDYKSKLNKNDESHLCSVGSYIVDLIFYLNDEKEQFALVIYLIEKCNKNFEEISALRECFERNIEIAKQNKLRFSNRQNITNNSTSSTSGQKTSNSTSTQVISSSAATQTQSTAKNAQPEINQQHKSEPQQTNTSSSSNTSSDSSDNDGCLLYIIFGLVGAGFAGPIGFFAGLWLASKVNKK